MKATEQYFAVARFITLYKVDPTFKSADEPLKRHHSNQLKLLSTTFVDQILTCLLFTGIFCRFIDRK